MNLRTVLDIEPSALKIDHASPVALIGSCFAGEIGEKMSEGKMNTLINPAGTVYNPVSIANTLNIIIGNRLFGETDLYKYNGRYLSLFHYTGFSSDTPGTLLDRINSNTNTSHNFLANARFLFVTFGTARIYRLKESGMIVSNCHKMPGSLFSQELLSVEEITSVWLKLLDSLKTFNTDLKVIFTISPVRHWKDGAHANQVSKSVLFLAVERLMDHPSAFNYFPAYEIIMDDLRDYRYYSDDMLHPSRTAIDYVWKSFCDCYLTPEGLSIWKEARKITKAKNHRLMTDSLSARREFANDILNLISSLEAKSPWIDLADERAYFEKMIM